MFGLLYLFSPNIIEFAFQARGYSIQIFCGIASYYFATDNKISAKVPFNASSISFYRVFLHFGGILLVNACLAISNSKGFNKIASAPLSFLKQAPAFLLIAAGCVLSYIYFDNYHKKDDLASAYRFKKIRSAIAAHKMVYTKNIGES